MRKLFGALLSLAFLGAILAAAGAVFAIGYYGRDLPDYTTLKDYEPPLVTRVHAGDGRLLAEFSTEKRVWTPIEAIPKRVSQAFIATEDQRFYDHPGIDVIGFARSSLTNVKALIQGRRLQGASTITQQVARNFLLTNERTASRKIREGILAWRLTQALPKDRVLELYLNEIYLGKGSHGVGAAAINYFDKRLEELTIAEAAFLAALPKAPANYDPDRFPDRAKDRRDWVISRMQVEGFITAEEAAAAKDEPLVTRKRPADQTVTASYFAEQVRRELYGLYGDKVYEGGFSVRTTVDPRLQEIATRAMRDGLMAYDRRHGWRGPVTHFDSMDGWAERLGKVAMPAGGERWRLAVVLETTDETAAIGFADKSRGSIPVAEMTWARPWMEKERLGPPVKTPADVVAVGDVVLVEPATEDAKGKPYPENSFALRQIPAVQGALIAMDPHTGRVLAMSGGFSYAKSEFNRATQAMRQTGSSIKPFVYLTALDNGFTPATVVEDRPIEIDQGPGLPPWRPANYSNDFLGPITLRVGLEKSRNLITVQIANAVGMDKVVATTKRFDIYDDAPPLLSYSLGAGETTPLRLTTAYGMLVNGGKKIEPTFIDRIQDRYGRTIYRRDERPCAACQEAAWNGELPVPEIPDDREQVQDPRTAYQIVAMMEGVVQRGTARSMLSLGRPIAGKTGTSNDEKDAWFVGFTPDLVFGAYVGFDNPRPLGAKETGGAVAAPIVKQFLAEALDGEPAVPFRVPAGLVNVPIDPATGQWAPAGTPGIVWEPFLPGSEPTRTRSSQSIWDAPVDDGAGDLLGPGIPGQQY